MLLPAVKVEAAVVARVLEPLAVRVPVPVLMLLLLVNMPLVQVPAISMAVMPVPVLLIYTPSSVVPVPVLVKESSLWVPEEVLLVNSPLKRFTAVPIEVSVTVYVELKG